MNDRLGNQRSANTTYFASLKRNPSREDLEAAIVQLEDCVKHGLLFHASHLSDWIMFVASDALREHRPCHQRLRIERLKRLGYLHFFDQESECRDELCESEDLPRYLQSPPDPADDDTRWRLYTAIGHTLWHEDDLDRFRSNFEHYGRLFHGLSEEFGGRAQMHAFLLGMEGRFAFLQRRDVTETMAKFDQALSLLTDAQRRTRVGLHLINYYLYHLISLYTMPQPAEDHERRSTRIDDLLFEFDSCRIGSSVQENGQPRPLRTLLQLHVGLHRLRKLKVDIARLHATGQDATDLEADVNAVQGDLLFTSAMLGLGSLNPCPPLLREIYEFCAVEGDGFNVNQAKKQLKSYLLMTNWEAFEEIAMIYFRHMGGLVETLPRREETFDLLVHTHATALHPATITGVQVKHERNTFPVAKFRAWRELAREYERRCDISRVIFFMQSSPDKSIARGKEVNRNTFPALQADIQFWNIDKITELLWQNPGCLPEIYGVIEKWRTQSPAKRTATSGTR